MKKSRTTARPKAPQKKTQTVSPARATTPAKPPPKKILLVDDDAVIRAVYGKKLAQSGFAVATAADGQKALEALQADRPDLVVLDMIMPKLSGVDVLKFIRAQPGLSSIPVAIFTNAFLDELAQAAVEIGVQKTVIKAECTPAKLIAIANELLSRDTGAVAKSPALAAGESQRTERKLEAAELISSDKARHDFLRDASATMAALRDLYQAFRKSPDLAARAARLDAFYRKVHEVTAITSLARCEHIALLSGVFEALLFELERTPDLITPSNLRTIAMTLDYVGVLFATVHDTSVDEPLASRVLVVDDDAVTNRAAIFALRRAHLQTSAVENPLAALKLLAETRYDLVLLDIEMPDINGFDFCRRLRALPGYAKTPVIYVTIHSDFESRAKGVLSGGDDLIAKPFLPIELAVKVVMNLIKSHLPASVPVARAEPAPAAAT
ncbi:MAG TPA: response regulator [Verrucomicrobiae bacterium]|nr:response regulator [Verrucomicrobiae bacterium]